MADIDTTVYASTDEIRRALGMLNDLRENKPLEFEGILAKNPDINPFMRWPLLKEPTEAFLRFFETATPVLEGGAETSTPALGPYTETVSSLGSQRNIDAKKLDELIDVFNKEYAEAKEGRVNAAAASKKFVSNFLEYAKKAGVPLTETQTPLPPAPQPIEETESAPTQYSEQPLTQTPAIEALTGTPVPPERIEEIAAAVIQRPEPPDAKIGMFHLLETFSSEQPDKAVDEMLPRAVAVIEASRVLATPGGSYPIEKSFSVLAANGFQESAARIFDAVVPAAVKESIVSEMILQPLEAIVNHPESLPKNIMGEMISRWGSNFVDSPWFNQLRADANRMMIDQKGEAKIKSRAALFVSDLATTVFHGPLDKNAVGADKLVKILNGDVPPLGGGAATKNKPARAPDKNVLPQEARSAAIDKLILALNSGTPSQGGGGVALSYNVIAYMETYRIVASQGVPMGNVSRYGGVVLGYGGQLIRGGANYAIKTGAKAIAKKVAAKAATTAVVEGGVVAAGTALAPGVGTLIALAVDFVGKLATNLIKKGTAVLKSVAFMGNSNRPEDNLLAVGLGVIALLFFLPILPLFNIPAFNQSMIDTSLATSIGGPTGATGAVGAATLSCADTSGAYVYQRDPLWADYTCQDANPSQPACSAANTSCTIGDSGCGSASTTIILKAFGDNTDVKTVWNQQHSTGGYQYDDVSSPPGCASYTGAPLSSFMSAGLSVVSLGVDGWSEAAHILNPGCGLILALGHAHINGVTTGHFIVITGIHEENGQVTSVDTLDPAQPTLTTQTIVGANATFTVDVGLWGVVK